MYKYSGFVTVRVQSSRLPYKCMIKLSGKTVLENIFERCLNDGIIPILCTTDLKSDDILEKIAEENNVKIFRGSNKNKIKRWVECAKYFDIDFFHTIDADDPFFDPNLVKSSFDLIYSKNLDFVLPSVYSSDGGGSVGYSIKTKVLENIVKNLDEDADTEMIQGYIDFAKYKTEIIDEDPGIDYQIRLTLDYEEDFYLLDYITRVLGPNPARQEIIKLFKRNPDLHKINFFRNQQWKSKQNNQISRLH